MLRAGSALLVLAAASWAQGTGGAPGRGELVDRLDHANPVVRAAAAAELGRLGDPAALPPLLGRLADPDAEVRARTVEALRRIGDERAVPGIAGLLDDPDETVRCRAVLALGDLGGRYLGPAVGRLLADPAPVVRAAAIRAVGELGDPVSLEAVLRAQAAEREDPDGAVTAASLVSAAKLGGPAGLGRALDLAAGRIEGSWLLRSVEAAAIGIAGDAARLPLLLRRLAGDEDPRVCEAAAGALARLGATDSLVKALEDPVVFRRRAAVAGLGETDGEAARRALLGATGDSDPGIAFEASAALLRRGERDAFPILFRLLSEDAPVWLGAVKVLEDATGLEFGRDPPRWEAWWRERRDRLRFDPAAGRYEGAR